MRFWTFAVFGLAFLLLPLGSAFAGWKESMAGDWRAAYACDAGEATCVAVSCKAGQKPKFGIWSTQFQSVSPSEMQSEVRFDIDIDGAASSLPVEAGEYLSDKRVIFWPMDRQLLADVRDGRALAIAGWGDPRMDLRDDERLVERTVEACPFTTVALREVQRAAGNSPWDAAGDTDRQAAFLKVIMPGGAECRRGDGDVSCRLGERQGSDLNSILARYDRRNQEFAIRAEIAHRDGDHEAYRQRLYDALAAFGVPASFADACLVKGAVAIDAGGSRVECDSYTPADSTVATISIRRL